MQSILSPAASLWKVSARFSDRDHFDGSACSGVMCGAALSMAWVACQTVRPATMNTLQPPGSLPGSGGSASGGWNFIPEYGATSEGGLLGVELFEAQFFDGFLILASLDGAEHSRFDPPG